MIALKVFPWEMLMAREVRQLDSGDGVISIDQIRLTTLLTLTLALFAACGESRLGATAEPAAPPTTAVSQEPLPPAASSAPSATVDLRPTANESLPAEIVAFKEKRDACDHFRGEEPYNAERREFLASEIIKHCSGTDHALAELRRRYSGNPNAMAALKDYEGKIE